MKKMKVNQRGGAIVPIIVLVLAAYGVFIGIQYVPIKIEFSSVDAILESIETTQRVEPASSLAAVKEKINNQLYINQRQHLADAFEVKQNGGRFTIRARFERELNMGYARKMMVYDNSLTLN